MNVPRLLTKSQLQDLRTTPHDQLVARVQEQSTIIVDLQQKMAVLHGTFQGESRLTSDQQTKIGELSFFA